MITPLALGQILWGVAYRWASLTNGDNGVNIHSRPAPFGISLSSAEAFYYVTLIVFLCAVISIARSSCARRSAPSVHAAFCPRSSRAA